MKRDTKTIIGKRHIEITKMAYDNPFTTITLRNITKVKSADIGFERFYATIKGMRVEVFQNVNGRTGAAFRLTA